MFENTSIECLIHVRWLVKFGVSFSKKFMNLGCDFRRPMAQTLSPAYGSYLKKVEFSCRFRMLSLFFENLHYFVAMSQRSL